MGRKEEERNYLQSYFLYLKKKSLQTQNQKRKLIAKKRTCQGMARMLLPGSRTSKEVWKLSGIKYSSGESFFTPMSL